MRTSYPTDLTDFQWSLVEPFVSPKYRTGRPRKLDLREVVNALLYFDRTGCQWRLLPHDFPNWTAVNYYWEKWRDDGTWDRLNAALREMVRGAEGRDPTPSAASIDTQSAKTTATAGERGYDGAKHVKGRKRCIVVDTLGLLLAVWVTPANADDGTSAPRVLERLDLPNLPRLRKVWADSKYRNHSLDEWLKSNGVPYELEVLDRPPGGKGFKLIPKRWVVERTFAWLGRFRRLSRDYEGRTESSEATIKLGMIHLMLNRLDRRHEAAKAPKVAKIA